MYLGTLLPQGGGGIAPDSYRSTLIIPGQTPGTSQTAVSTSAPAPAPAVARFSPYTQTPVVPGTPGVFDITRANRVAPELNIPPTVINPSGPSAPTDMHPYATSGATVPTVNWIPALIAGGLLFLSALF
jgi:hypothetical protein